MFVYDFVRCASLEDYSNWLKTLEAAPSSLEIISVNNVYWHIVVTYRYEIIDGVSQ